jgi:hypothetical protein
MYTIKYAQHPLSYSCNEYINTDNLAEYLELDSYEAKLNQGKRRGLAGRYGHTILEVCVIKDNAKARKPELYRGEIMCLMAQCREYCEVMLLPIPLWAQVPEDIEAGAPLKAALKLHFEGETP